MSVFAAATHQGGQRPLLNWLICRTPSPSSDWPLGVKEAHRDRD
jgi:hypothetical protein